MTESKISTEKPSRKEKKPSGEKATKPLTKVRLESACSNTD